MAGSETAGRAPVTLRKRLRGKALSQTAASQSAAAFGAFLVSQKRSLLQPIWWIMYTPLGVQAEIKFL